MLQDEFYIKHLADKHILGPVLDVLINTLPRDNLLCSACLELFGLINKENIKELIKHLVENYREKLTTLVYIDTFRDILHRYDQTDGFTNNGETYFIESEDEIARKPTVPGGARAMMEQLAVDPAQEDYWDGPSDDDEENQQPVSESATGSNGTNSRKPLVEYTSDEDAEDGCDAVMTGNDTPPKDEQGKENKDPAAGIQNAAAPTPPERISEKRRREEEDDDALDKLVSHKRRSSISSVESNSSSRSVGVFSTTSSVGSPELRKKKGAFGGGNREHRANGPRKISINISPSSSTSATAIKSAAAQAEAEAEAEEEAQGESGKSPPAGAEPAASSGDVGITAASSSTVEEPVTAHALSSSTE